MPTYSLFLMVLAIYATVLQIWQLATIHAFHVHYGSAVHVTKPAWTIMLATPAVQAAFLVSLFV